MLKILKDRSFLIAIILTAIFLVTGFTTLHYGYVQYGVLVFLALPVVLGLSIGALPSRRAAWTGFLISLAFFMIGVVSLGMEGYVCMLMVLPLILPPIFLAAVVVHLARRYHVIKATDKLPVLVLPLFIFLIGIPVEHSFQHKKETIEVHSAIELPCTPAEAYDHILSVDTLIAGKSWLMQLGLPVPQKCILDKEAVGALRTCYFSGGTITERITAFEKGKHLKMDVVGYELTGRKWLGFKEAIYLFDSLPGNRCRMTRITTYTSELKPRVYWEPVERMGVAQEHEFVFANLLRELKEEKQ